MKTASLLFLLLSGPQWPGEASLETAVEVVQDWVISVFRTK